MNDGKDDSTILFQPGAFLPPTVEELNRRIPAYEFIEFVDRGGMGAVYKARQRSLNRMVAVKLLPPAMADRTTFVERFKREAHALAQLNHPHIVAVHDSGEADNGCLYYVMEFINGSDLSRMMRSGQLTARQRLTIVMQVCDALQYAHEKGVVHRDIKPSNILLDERGRVKVADFGLAKLLHPDHRGHTLTSSSDTLGTPEYIAPEALEAEGDVDHRVDIYSLGVMLYEMLTGHTPKGTWEPPSQCGADSRLDDVVARALQPDREKRFQHVREMTAQIQPLMREETKGGRKNTAAPQQAAGPSRKPPPLPLPPTARGKKIAALLGAALLAGGGLALWKNSAEHVWLGFHPGGGQHGLSAAGDSEKKDGAAAGAQVPSTGFTNSLGMKFVPVPGTKILMCIHETRRKDYAAYAAENTGINDEWTDATSRKIEPVGARDDDPVVCVSWHDASAFCAWLSKKEGRNFRLPTDREWSIAVGLGDDELEGPAPIRLNGAVPDVYPWGSQWPPPQGAGNFGDRTRAIALGSEAIEGYTDGFATTSPVMSFTPNKLGIYDLAGNVWEWCEDRYDDSAEDRRVLRGGSWSDSNAKQLLSSTRWALLAGERHPPFGFRCVVELTKPE